MVYTVVVRNAPLVKYQFKTLAEIKKNALDIILNAKGKKWDKYLLVYDGEYSPKKEPIMTIERNEMDFSYFEPFNLIVTTWDKNGKELSQTDLVFNMDKVSKKKLETMWKIENSLTHD